MELMTLLKLCGIGGICLIIIGIIYLYYLTYHSPSVINGGYDKKMKQEIEK